ncbi:unnamed protein product [Lupinus luteus]|uniref:Uncharacterized protein n=1 Tax=Lupinus luteus TaxID=3873 RepID=A0AAV1X5G9_LUPLU
MDKEKKYASRGQGGEANKLYERPTLVRKLIDKAVIRAPQALIVVVAVAPLFQRELERLLPLNGGQ